MQYAIYDSKNRLYIKKDKNVYVLVTDVQKATKYSDLKKVKNICGNLPKALCDYNFGVVEVFKDDSVVLEDDVDNSEPNDSKEEFNLDYDILDKAREIASVVRQAEKRKIYLANKLKELDLAIVDIEHAAEFYNLNAAQGYNLYKMLHDTTIERRKCKDELQILGNFLYSSIDSKSMENFEKSVIGLSNRKYKPRVINELFDV